MKIWRDAGPDPGLERQRSRARSAAQQWMVDPPGNVLSFGQDAQGELYLLTGSGRVLRIVRR